MSEALKEFVRKRGPIKGSLTLFVKSVDSLSNSAELTAKQINELKLRQRTAANLLQIFNTIQYAIRELVDEREYDKQLLEREMFENSYYSAMSTIECLLENQKVSDTKLVRILITAKTSYWLNCPLYRYPHSMDAMKID